MNPRLRLTLAEGDECHAGGKRKIHYELICDRNADEVEVMKQADFMTDNCENTIYLKSKHACPKYSFRPWTYKIPVSKNILGGLLIIVGLLFVLLGKKYNQYFLNIIILFGCGLFVYSVMEPIFHFDLPTSLVIGALLGVLFAFYLKIAVYVTMVLFGFFLTNIFYNFTEREVEDQFQDWVYWLCFVIIVGVLVYLNTLVRDTEKTIGSVMNSLVGAYAIARGAACFIGSYPDEVWVMALAHRGETAQLARLVGHIQLIYGLVIIILWVLGLYLQDIIVIGTEDTKSQEKSGQFLNDAPDSEPLNKN